MPGETPTQPSLESERQTERLVLLDEKYLLEPIPPMDEDRKLKPGYQERVFPVDESNPKSREWIVDIGDYGIAGQPYYSRPNPSTGDPLPEAIPYCYLRKSVAKILAQINEALKDPRFTDFFDGPVELYVQDALRTEQLQTKLYEDAFPDLIRRQHPSWSEAEVAKRRDQIVAKKGGPHTAGGAFDVKIRYAQPTKGYVLDSEIPIGQRKAETRELINPDYFEYTAPESDEEKLFQRNRRAFYNIMTGRAFGIETGLVNNPTEWWHWGTGDNLSCHLQGKEKITYPPIYSFGGRFYRKGPGEQK